MTIGSLKSLASLGKTPARKWALFGLLAIFTAAICSVAVAAEPQVVTGRVFVDENASGTFDAGDRPVEGVRVSNGREVAVTDAQGRYELPLAGDAQIFVIKPQGYRTPLSADNLPQFFYLHRPKGSPPMRYAGIAPTGPLPQSIDFPLYLQEEPDEFRVVLFGDPQPRNLDEVNYIIRDVVEELARDDVKGKAAFGISLGDIAFDDLTTFEPLNAAVAKIGLPWINVLGNHDCNFDAPDLAQSYETFRRVYGPDYYAFDYGPAHFLVLNTVVWLEQDGRRYYRGGLGEDQLAFLANNLKHVPRDRLLVIVMHIPLSYSTPWVEGDLEALFRLIDDRPHTVSFSAHTHTHEHRFLGGNLGWRGERPHHHVIHGTICGSWWAGAPDEYGIPHTMMADGTPNGYSILTIRGSEYQLRYKAFRRPADFQMHLHAPEAISAAETGAAELFVNVFNALPDAKVAMRVGAGGPPLAMTRSLEPDPVFLNMLAQNARVESPFWRAPPRPKASTHLWKANLPADLPPGMHLVEVEAHNPDGQTFRGVRVIRVTP